MTPRVLLLADQPWDAGGGGAVILRSLIGDDLGGLVWATPAKATADAARVGLTAGSLGRTGRFSAFADTLRHANHLALEVRELMTVTNSAAVWAVLHGATVSVAARLATLGVPLHCTVHDDPVHSTALRSRRLAILAPLIARDLRTALTAAQSVDVVCEQMAERYRRKFSIESVILHRGTTAEVEPAPEYDVRASGVRVGVLGNTYSYRQLPALGAAVELAAKQLGVPGCIVVCGAGYGDRLKWELAGRVSVEVRGHLAEPASVAALRSCGALYLNYPFGRWSRVLRETSFPTKLSTYVYAARPLLIHGPPSTSTAGLPADFPGYAVAWETASPAEGAAALVKVLADGTSRHTAAEAVRRRYYDLVAHRATLAGVMARFTLPAGPSA
jgi:hypothetical protein